jgi:hypothetical protein
MPEVLDQLSTYFKAAKDFREQVTNMHKELPLQERIEARLIDVLCVLNMEFYIRPQNKDE